MDNNNNQPERKDTELVKDPVCGMVIPKSRMKYSSEFLGKVYYFDTEQDKSLFDAYPDYWVPEEERLKFRKGKY